MAEVIVEESNQKEVGHQWSDLPPGILCMIASRALAYDPGAIANIRAVCKLWKNSMHNINYDIVRCPMFDSIPPIISTQNPCLMSLKGQVCEFYLRSCNVRIEIPELKDAYIRFFKFSWLLLSRRDKSNFLFHLPTRHKIELPNSSLGFNSMCFSHPPTSPHCYVLGWTRRLRSIGMIRPREEQWSFYDGEHVERYGRFTNSHPVFYKDHCYCLRDDGHIVVFDIKNKKLFLLWNTFRGFFCTNNFLVENAGHLLAVFVSKEEQNVYITRFNISKKLWRPVENLRNNTLFVSHTSSFLKPALVHAMGNNIYFSKIRENDYVVYSLATGKYHSFLDGYSRKSPLDVEESRNSVWIENLDLRILPKN